MGAFFSYFRKRKDNIEPTARETKQAMSQIQSIAKQIRSKSSPKAEQVRSKSSQKSNSEANSEDLVDIVTKELKRDGIKMTEDQQLRLNAITNKVKMSRNNPYGKPMNDEDIYNLAHYFVNNDEKTTNKFRQKLQNKRSQHRESLGKRLQLKDPNEKKLFDQKASKRIATMNDLESFIEKSQSVRNPVQQSIVGGKRRKGKRKGKGRATQKRKRR